MDERRVQLRRTAGWRMPSDATKIDRSTQWGNPYAVTGPLRDNANAIEQWWIAMPNGGIWRFQTEHKARVEAVRLYREWLAEERNLLLRNCIRSTFTHRRPACWCKHDQPCHGDVILEVVATPWEHATS